MNDKTRAAMQQALECAERCESIDGMYSWADTITALREALANTRSSIRSTSEYSEQAEQQSGECTEYYKGFQCGAETMKLVLEQADQEQEQVAVLDITYGREPECYATPNAEDLPEGTYRLYAAPVQQAEQEPVAWVWLEDWLNDGYPEDCFSRVNHQGKAPLYAAHVRTKDLTDDEIWEIWFKDITLDWDERCRAVIAADREKNK